MKKIKYLSVCLLIISLANMAGCGGSDEANIPVAPASQTKKDKTDKNISTIVEPLDENIKKTDKVEVYSYLPAGRRDPFRSILVKKEEARESTKKGAAILPLQKIDLSRLQLIAIVWGEFGFKAMVQTPDGKGYTIDKGSRMGTNNGIVTQITSETVTINEKFSDPLGEEQTIKTVLKLHPYKGEQE